MDFDLTGDQQRLVERTRDYAERVIRPASGRLDQLDGAEDLPFDLMREGSALGLKALPLPRDLGGINADMVTPVPGWPAGPERSPPARSPLPLPCAPVPQHT
jgi:alkylation response protein AidB-like acyl-CoA dehydrogenase